MPGPTAARQVIGAAAAVVGTAADDAIVVAPAAALTPRPISIASSARQ